MEVFLQEEQYGMKDMYEMIESNILPAAICAHGADFLDWIESFYDNDGNYTDVGLSEDGLEHLLKYKKNYGLS